MSTLFASKVAIFGPRLMKDLGLDALDAAAIFGNIGWESGGFERLHEMGQRAGRGGLGWCQWTARRRQLYEGYCKAHGVSPTSDQANYNYLLTELHGIEASALTALKRSATLSGKVSAFCRVFERPRILALSGREGYARQALAILDPGHPATVAPAPKQRAPRHPARANKPVGHKAHHGRRH